ncbi:MAG: fibronectin type III domain-containing protein [ANME-2 cluster archaeon]|nr:fibronectin type III domain-containing protein [ANME-2 cluster archaeon]
MFNIQNSLIVVFLILFIVFATGTAGATSDCLGCHAENVTIMPDIENPHLLPGPVQSVTAVSTTGFEAGILSTSSPPLVYDITARGKATTAFIAWKTNKSTDDRVYYGTNEADITAWVNGTWSNWKNNTISPSITLTDLSTNTTYYYRIESTDDYGNVNTDIPVRSFTTALLNIELSTNRIVILDDPMYAGSTAAPGYENPPDPILQQNWTGNDWDNDYWNNESTTIRAYVLVMDVQGMGADSASVDFILKNPAGIVIDQSSSFTDSGGIASYLFDMNNKNEWGTWTIEANSTVNGNYVNSSTEFTLNWWGCALCHGDPGTIVFNKTLSMNGNANNPDFPIPNSPYAMGYDMAHQLTVASGNVSNFHGKYYDFKWYGEGHENFTYNPTGYGQFPDTKCVHCHQGYDGYPGGNTTATYLDYRQDYHNFSCDSHACHANEGWQQPYQSNNGIPEMKSCGFQFIPYGDAGHEHTQPQCHVIWGDVYDIPYVAGGNGNLTIVPTLDDNNIDSNDQARVNYSDSIPASGNPLRLHTINANVPCVICHGPNHGIKNPDPSTFERRLPAVDEADKIAGGCTICHQPDPGDLDPESTCEVCHVGRNTVTFEQNSNGTTEISHCQTCHTQKQHNASVDCTVCHSQDAHIINYFDNSGSYDTSKSNAGNCTTCHQKSRLTAILANSKAGTYSGNTPLVNDPLTHSNNSYSGTLWDRGTRYWDNTNQVTTCLYCHGNTTHNATALGYPDFFKGSNTVSGSFVSATWCAGCHYQNNSNYNSMVSTMDPVPPEITNNASYGTYTTAIDGTNYYDHTGIRGFNDPDCGGCHNNSAINSTQLMHGTVTGAAGGPDCIGCHQGSGIPGSATINRTLFNQTPHVNINDGNGTNSRSCWLCHGNGSAQTRSDHSVNVNLSMVKSCTDVQCHGNISSSEATFNIVSHSPTADTKYVRTNATSAGCEDCHSALNVLVYNESKPGNASSTGMLLSAGPVGHYVKNLVDYDNDKHFVIDSVGWSDGGQKGSQGCVYCHRTDNGTLFNATNITQLGNHDNVGNNCYGCHIVGTTTLHDVGVINASAGGPDCLLCHGDAGGEILPDVNISAFNNSVHSNLNNNASNVSVLSNDLSKACWACHGNGSEPGKHPSEAITATNPANVTFPLDCTEGDCHVNGTPAGSTFNDSIPNVTEHVPAALNDPDINTDHNCSASCHVNSLSPRGEPETGIRNATDLSNVSHYGTITGPEIARVQINTPNCIDCHRNVTNALLWGNATQIRHPVNKSAGFCANCHGSGSSLHAGNLSFAPEIHTAGFDWEDDGIDYYAIYPPLLSQDMEGCYACHNGTVDFILMGLDVNDDNSRICEECHYNNSPGPFTTKISMRSDVSNAIPRVFNHINDSTNATVVIRTNLTVSGTSQLSRPSTCFNYNNNTGNGACHGVSYEKRTDAGGYYAFNNSEISLKSSTNMSPYRYTQTIDHMPNTSDCRICHLGANASIGTLVESVYWGNPMNVTSTAPTIPAHINVDARIDDCWACHVFGGFQPVDFHDVNITGGGGPDCIRCHDVGRSGATRWVNVSALNGSLNSNASIHYAINNATTGTGGSTGNPDNQICWACHHSDGSEPSGMGDIFKQPYQCYDCHNGTAAYSNVSNAPGVYQHFVNATNLTAGNITSNTTNSSSCLVCHTIPEMKVSYSEGADIFSTNYSLPSHYGRTRTDLRTWTADGLGVETVDCKYCHNNSTSAFKVAMNDPLNNSNISEHSPGYPGSTPNCTNSACHRGGWMHNDTLAKPDLMIGGAEDSDVCNTCHSPANASGNMTATTGKTLHNASVNCSECHLFEARDIHGIKYLQQDDTYSTSNSSSTVVDCVRCHNNNTVLNNLSIDSVPPLVPTDNTMGFNHGEDPDNGSRWANTSVNYYWNSMNGACEYCHNDTKHQANAFGLIANIKGSNTRNDTIDTSNNWCSGCHYQAADNYFVAGNWSKVPPTIYYNNVNLSNATDDANILWFNHTLSDYSDGSCKGCHGNLLSVSPTTKEFAHNVNSANITNCVRCHDALRNIVPANRQLNIAAMNNSSESIHYDLNNAITDGNINQRCYACHGNGSAPAIHPSLSDVKLCDECHVTLNFSAPLVGRHIPNASTPQQFSTSNITTNYADCWICHNNSVNTSATMWQNNRSLVSHYSTNSSLVRTNSNDTVDECYNCHWNTTNQYKYGNAPQTQMASRIQCYECHNGEWKLERRSPDLPKTWVFYSSEPGVLHNQKMGTYWACSTCH